MTNEEYMRTCFRLAKRGMGSVAPNPMVGAIVVHNGEIIGQGFHEKYGCAHAEPNAINSVIANVGARATTLLKESTLFVNLEPCSHFGKMPPCVDLIIKKKIPEVVICNIDPNPQVSGKGIRKLREAGVKVTSGVLAEEGWKLNKRFFTFHTKKRPYIFLKWAQSADGFIDKKREDVSISPMVFSTPESRKLSHRMRAEESAILVGTNTVLLDNPALTTRLWTGKNPIRIAIDRDGQIPPNAQLFDESAETIIFSQETKKINNFVNFVAINFSKNILPQIMRELYNRKIISLIVEGGAKTLQTFINQNLWDEARIETSPVMLGNGIKAPNLNENLLYHADLQFVGENKIDCYKKCLYGLT